MKNKVRRFRPWEGQWTIAHRILALNLLILVVFAVSVLYLDAFRNQRLNLKAGGFIIANLAYVTAAHPQTRQRNH